MSCGKSNRNDCSPVRRTMSRHFLLLLLSPLFFAAGGDNLPTQGGKPSAVQEYDTALTDNSFLLTGGGYNEARVDMTGGLHESLIRGTTGETAVVVETGHIRQPGKDQQSMTVVLQFPVARGGFAWDNLYLKEPDSTTVHAVISIASEQYLSVEGRTEAILVPDAFGEITGRYSGTLVSAFGDTITIADGRFSVPASR